MTGQFIGPAVVGLAWPWFVAAVFHGHVRLNRGCLFLFHWQFAALVSTIGALAVGHLGSHVLEIRSFGWAAGATASGLIAGLIDWWKRRGRTAASELGYKARKRIADLVRALRDSIQPRPVLQPAPGGAS